MSSPAREPRSQSFVLGVQRELERAIAAGELTGGDRINESALAIKLGIGRGPVREACRTLEQTGVLRSAINRGYFVREISLKEALEIYDLRATLCGMAGRLAARVPSRAPSSPSSTGSSTGWRRRLRPRTSAPSIRSIASFTP